MLQLDCRRDLQALRQRALAEVEDYINDNWDNPMAAWSRKNPDNLRPLPPHPSEEPDHSTASLSVYVQGTLYLDWAVSFDVSMAEFLVSLARDQEKVRVP